MTDQVTLSLGDVPLDDRAAALVAAGHSRAKQIDWFDFIASDYRIVFTVLSAMRRGRFCEWGSGMGVVTGLAEILGFEAVGIELHEPLVVQSRELLKEFSLQAQIELADYFDVCPEADLYFAYCWPGQVERTEQRFFSAAPPGSQLLIYFGRNDIRWMQKT